MNVHQCACMHIKKNPLGMSVGKLGSFIRDCPAVCLSGFLPSPLYDPLSAFRRRFRPRPLFLQRAVGGITSGAPSFACLRSSRVRKAASARACPPPPKLLRLARPRPRPLPSGKVALVPSRPPTLPPRRSPLSLAVSSNHQSAGWASKAACLSTAVRGAFHSLTHLASALAAHDGETTRGAKAKATTRKRRIVLTNES